MPRALTTAFAARRGVLTRMAALVRARRWSSRRRLIRSGIVIQGRGTYGRPTVRYFEGDSARVAIGQYCSIAGGVEILPGGNHRTDWVSTYPFRARYRLAGAGVDGHPSTKGDVRIGNDVWIGRGAMILSGVEIGDGAVVAARAVVVTNVEPYAIVGGNPARVIGHRFSQTQREQLMRIRWWDWPHETILDRVADLNGTTIDEFITRYGSDDGPRSTERSDGGGVTP